jgi:PPM family protein phosphatase
VTVLRSGSATDVGRRRTINEDLPLQATNLFAVADGMGGHVGGEVAARVAIDALREEFTREPTAAGLQGAFSKANLAVWKESQDNSELRGMGTTLTAMALVGGADGRDTLALANVGDSRAYVCSRGQIMQVTADHSLAEERMRQGEMTEAEAAVHPQRHILTRALGVSLEVEADMWELRLRSGDRVVLCSDGLSNELEPDEILQVLTTVADPDEAARQLVDVANQHGGSDNITVVVVDVLVGEDGGAKGSVVMPMGVANGTPSTIANGGASSAPLAPGSRLGFSGGLAALPGADPKSGEFFPGDTTQAVPVARATVRAAVPARRLQETVPEGESRRARRRRLGIPRRITFRVVFFILLVAAVPTGAFFAIRWYAYDNWFLSAKGHEIVIEQGRLGGELWFNPKVVSHTGIKTSQVLPAGLAQIHSGVQEATLAGAKRYVTNLHAQYEFLQDAAARAKKKAAANAKAAAASPSTTVPLKTTTTTVAPQSPVVTTTTVG